MLTRSKLVIAVSAAIWMVPITRAVAGIDVTAGDWKLDFSGNVNAFYVGTSCDNANNPGINGGLACAGDNSSSVRNGLLPAAIVFSATTRQDNLDIGVTIGLYPGINSSLGGAVNGAGNPAALQSPGIDARQAFLTFGDKSWGTVKMGRDIGLFGKDAILDDMTLLGVGSAPNNAAPSNTSLGRIGLGYIYTDWEPQITYTTPTYSGFSASAGVFQPLTPLTDPQYSKHTAPQFQIGGSYAWGDAQSLSGKVWVDFVTQQYQYSGAAPTGTATSITGNAFDGGVKLSYMGFDGVLYGYSGSGIGTTGLFAYALSSTGSGDKRDSDGGYVQAAYTINKLKIGVSYGMSELKMASDEVATGNQNVKRNSSVVGGLYYSLTKSLTLVGEYIDTKADAWSGSSDHEHDFALGAILFF
jgi:predicted porin